VRSARVDLSTAYVPSEGRRCSSHYANRVCKWDDVDRRSSGQAVHPEFLFAGLRMECEKALTASRAFPTTFRPLSYSCT
jgi:hypothetical protein